MYCSEPWRLRAVGGCVYYSRPFLRVLYYFGVGFYLVDEVDL